MATTIYTHHRENQRDLILEVSTDLFIKEGIEHVSIGKIANAARLTRATIYKYFSNKEEIAKEIFKAITLKWNQRNKENVWSLQGVGHAQVERFMKSHFEYMMQNPRESAFIAAFNYLYARAWSAEEALKLFRETNMENDREQLDACISRGQADGSIRSDIDKEIVLASIFNFNNGILTRFAEMGAKVEEEYEIDMHNLFLQICQIFLDGLRPR